MINRVYIETSIPSFYYLLWPPIIGAIFCSHGIVKISLIPISLVISVSLTKVSFQ